MEEGWLNNMSLCNFSLNASHNVHIGRTDGSLCAKDSPPLNLFLNKFFFTQQCLSRKPYFPTLRMAWDWCSTHDYCARDKRSDQVHKRTVWATLAMRPFRFGSWIVLSFLTQSSSGSSLALSCLPMTMMQRQRNCWKPMVSTFPPVTSFLLLELRTCRLSNEIHYYWWNFTAQ